jgi:sigma-E factor negative regulatory protein RseB
VRVSPVKVLNSKVVIRSVISLISLLLVSQVRADSCPEVNHEALAWLDKMSHSAREVSYQGVVTFQLGDDIQVMQISHSVSDAGASESLTQLTGQGARVTRENHPLDCIHPGHKLLRLSEEVSQSAKLTGSTGPKSCGISEHYQFTVLEGERIAGRKAVRIVIEPRDMYRYGYVMELDNKTGLLLKERTIGRGNKVLERFQFANISYTNDNIPTDSVDVVHHASHSGAQSHSTVEPSTDHYPVALWNPGWLPKGFMSTDEASGSERRRTYTDGLAVFSVFLEILPRDIQAGEGVVRRGGTTSYTRGMRMGSKPALITIIGEVPVNTARMVADSVRWVE